MAKHQISNNRNLIIVGLILGTIALGFVLLKNQQASLSKNIQNTSPTLTTKDPWLTDDDSDSLPSIVELATGGNPNESFDITCGQKTCNYDNKETPQKISNLLFLIDSSGSMAARFDNSTRMEVAKKVLNDYLAQVPSDGKVGLIVYGHKGSSAAADKSISCAGIESIYDLASPDQTKWSQIISTLKPVGYTPIGGALDKAREVLATHKGEATQIIIISDGIETCGTDPVAKARAMKAEGITVKVDVVAMQVSQADGSLLSQIAAAGGGTFQNVQSSEDLGKKIRDFANEQEKFTKTVRCNTTQWISYTKCLSTTRDSAIKYIDTNYPACVAKNFKTCQSLKSSIIDQTMKYFNVGTDKAINANDDASTNWYKTTPTPSAP